MLVIPFLGTLPIEWVCLHCMGSSPLLNHTHYEITTCPSYQATPTMRYNLSYYPTEIPSKQMTETSHSVQCEDMCLYHCTVMTPNKFSLFSGQRVLLVSHGVTLLAQLLNFFCYYAQIDANFVRGSSSDCCTHDWAITIHTVSY